MTNQRKTLDTLVEDIDELFENEEDYFVNEENLDQLAENIKEVLRTSFRKREVGPSLRFSNIGLPDRKLWYSSRPDVEGEKFSGKTLFKFLYGNVIEELVLFLAQEAGHTVEKQQEEVEAEGVKGHVDAVIDGVVVDVKSASPFSFRKFMDGSVLVDDPFGYIPQISGYTNELTPGKSAAFIAFNKVDGDLTVTTIPASVVEGYQPGPRIEHLKTVIASDTPPPRCYEDEPDGKSGNRKLGTACSYCAFKQTCWPELRTFLYSGRPRFLTKVVKTPNVQELPNNG